MNGLLEHLRFRAMKVRSLVFLVLALAFCFQGTALAEEPKNIEEGVYEIRSKVSDKALNIACGLYEGCVNVETFDANDTVAQRWRIEHKDGHYSIVNALSGVSLNVAAAGMRDGTNVETYTANGTKAQQWDFIPDSKGGYAIRSVLNSRVLDVQYGSRSNGANVWMYSANGSDAQSWSLKRIEQTVDEGVYQIGASRDNGMVVEVANASAVDGARVQLWKGQGGSSQRWSLDYDKSNGYYSFVNVGSGKALDIPGASRIPGEKLQQYDANGTAAQLWSVRKGQNGNVQIVSALTGRLLDLPSGRLENGNPIQTWDANGNQAQDWKLASASLLSEGLYQVRSLEGAGLSLDVSAASMAADAKIQLWSGNGTLAQKWVVDHSENDSVSLKSANSGLYLSDNGGRVTSSSSVGNRERWRAGFIKGGGVALVNVATGRVLSAESGGAQGASVSTRSKDGSKAQSWRFVATSPLEEGCYVFQNRSNLGQVVDVRNGSTASGARVQTFGSNGTDAQKWYVNSEGDGWYSIVNAKSALALDVMGAAGASGTAVWQYTPNGSKAQQWKFSVGPHGGLVMTSRLGNYVLAPESKAANGTSLIISSSLTDEKSAWIPSATSVVQDPGESEPDSWVFDDPGYTNRMVEIAKQYGSSTDWFATVDKAAARATFLKRSGSSWKVVTGFDVIVTDHTFTSNTVFKVHHKARSLWADETPSGLGKDINPWWVCFIASWTSDSAGGVNRWYPDALGPGQGAYDDGQGFHFGYSSGGCTVIDNEVSAKWVYDTIPIGTSVRVF